MSSKREVQKHKKVDSLPSYQLLWFLASIYLRYLPSHQILWFIASIQLKYRGQFTLVSTVMVISEHLGLWSKDYVAIPRLFVCLIASNSSYTRNLTWWSDEVCNKQYEFHVSNSRQSPTLINLIRKSRSLTDPNNHEFPCCF